MSTYEKAAAIFVETLPECRSLPLSAAARKLLDALYAQGIAPLAIKASEYLFKRFHAHCSYLGKETGRGYKDIYNAAVQHAMDRGMWGFEMLAVSFVDKKGVIHTGDVQIPGSTKDASNKRLLCAYEYITDTAAVHKISLPENPGAMDE